MFTKDMKEKRSQEVVIKDVDYQTMKLLIDYIYTGTIEECPDKSKFKDQLISLLHASDEYNVFELYEAASLKLMLIMDDSNLSSILAHSFLYNAEQLKKVCLQRLYEHKSIDFSKWDELITEFANTLMNNQN